jgi:hypothetical protein
MEVIVLSESFTLFLLLATLLAFRSLQLQGVKVAAAAGLGATCALLYHTKPQFGFVIVLFAMALLFSRLRSFRSIAAFGAPVLALQILVVVIDSSAGNFRGVTSMLGYSLFDHAQQLLTCPSSDSDPHVQYYCQARAAIGNAGAPTGYTAWLIYPAMHGLQESFPEATADYAKLSFRLLAAHPVWYVGSAARSFWDFWTDDVPMVAPVFAGRGANMILALDRFLRRGIEIGFFVSLAALFFERVWRDGDRFFFGAVTALTVLGSATVQALAESGNEQARFAVPTMPLLTIVTVYLAAMILAREPHYNVVESERPAFS